MEELRIRECQDVGQRIKRFQFLQEERVHTYRLFDEGYQAYLATGPSYNFPMFQQLVSKITEKFKTISDEIIKMNHEFSTDPNLKAVASCISKIQDCEKNKLELTARFQILTQNVIDDPGDDEHKSELNKVKQELRKTMDEINEHLEELKYESEDFLK